MYAFLSHELTFWFPSGGERGDVAGQVGTSVETANVDGRLRSPRISADIQSTGQAELQALSSPSAAVMAALKLAKV